MKRTDLLTQAPALRKPGTMAALLLTVCTLQSQVYNYDPIRYSNMETTPSYIASGQSRYAVSLMHQGGFSKHGFYSDALKLSGYSYKCFSGIGLTVNNTFLNDSTHYAYVGLGAAFRTILFGRIYTKVGLMYKLMSVTSAPGLFSYYAFNRTADGAIKQSTLSNANMSVTFSSGRDKYYLTVGILNVPVQAGAYPGLFPQYYILNAGDLAKICHLSNWEISYTAFTKRSGSQNVMSLSQSVSIMYGGFHLTRASSIRCGLRAGITDQAYLQLMPMISFYHRTNRRRFITYQLMYDIAAPYKTSRIPYQPVPQFNLTYLL